MPEVYLETQRLIIRTKRPSDLSNEHLMDTDEEVRRYTGGIADLQMTIEYFNRNIEQSLGSGYGYFAVTLKPHDEMIGWVCLKECPFLGKMEIGYQLMKNYWGHGITTEAAHRMLQYGFQYQQLPEIWAIINPANTASRRVVDKLGFRYMRRQQSEPDHTMIDLFCLRNDEFFSAVLPLSG